MAGTYRVEKWKEFHVPNAAMLRNILVMEGFQVYQWTDRPGTYYGPHKHPEDQCHWIISGSLMLNIDRIGTIVLETGDRDFLPAETYHTAEAIGEEPVLYLVGELKR